MKIFTVIPDTPIGFRINGSRFGVPGCAPTSYYLEKTMKASHVKNCRFRHLKKMIPGWPIVLAVGGIIVILVMNFESHASRHTRLVQLNPV